MTDADDGLAVTRDSGRREWAERAAAWRRWAPQWAVQTSEATGLIVEAARIAPGMQVLDVASGSGEPALTLAVAVGPHGQVTATDAVPAMLAIAADTARQRALTNLTFVVSGAEQLPFADAFFDAVTCRFGIAHVPDYGRALDEARRVLKPGRPAAFVVWGPRERNPFYTIVDRALTPYPAPPTPSPGGPGAFTFASAGALSAALGSAGFRQIHEQSRAITLRWPGSAEQAWQGRCEMSAACSRSLAALTPADRARVAEAVLRTLRTYADGPQIALPARVVLATGTR